VTKIQRDSTLKYVPLGKMRLNPVAQRELRPAWAAEIASNFDPNKMAAPHVNHRDEFFYIMDGQHTIEAARLSGYTDVDSVECFVYVGLTEAEEAEKFLELNNRKAVRAFDKFRAGVTARRPAPVEITQVLDANGLHVGNNIRCVAALETVHKAGGADLLNRTVGIINDAFGVDGFDSNIVKGVGLLCHRYNGSLDDARAAQQLAKMRNGHVGLLTKANVYRSTHGAQPSHAVAAACVDEINRGRGGKKLPTWWKANA